MTMTWADVQVGQDVTVSERFVTDESNGYGQVEFNQGNRYRVRRVATSKVVLRDMVRGRSGWVPLMQIAALDGSERPPRQLGETPEGDHISIDDPRIAWIWDDAAKVADKAGYCGTYDQLADKLGAPGREKNYNVWTEVHGLKARITVKARSKKLAEAMVTAKMAGVVIERSSEE